MNAAAYIIEGNANAPVLFMALEQWGASVTLTYTIDG
jgi:hypothetical protein